MICAAAHSLLTILYPNTSSLSFKGFFPYCVSRVWQLYLGNNTAISNLHIFVFDTRKIHIAMFWMIFLTLVLLGFIYLTIDAKFCWQILLTNVLSWRNRITRASLGENVLPVTTLSCVFTFHEYCNTDSFPYYDTIYIFSVVQETTFANNIDFLLYRHPMWVSE